MGMYEGRVKVRKVSFQGVRGLGTIAGSKPRDVGGWGLVGEGCLLVARGLSGDG